MSDGSRDPSPSAEERKTKEAEDKKREEEEQATLPYKWTQTLEEADVNVPIPGNLKSRDLVVELKKQHLKVQVKGQEAIIDVRTISHTLILLYTRWQPAATSALRSLTLFTGRFPTSHSGRRLNLDSHHTCGLLQRNRYQPRQSGWLQLVASYRHHRTQN